MKNLKSRRTLRLIAAATALAAVIFVTVAWFGGGDSSNRYRTQTVARGDLVSIVTATGNLQPTNQVDIGIEVSGLVSTVEVDFNDRVTAGQVLARLDPAKLNSQVLRSRAALESAKAKFEQAKATVAEARSAMDRIEQVRKLSGGKLPSKQEADAAQAVLLRAQAEQTAAEAAIAEAAASLEVSETDLVRSVVKSPINGIIISRSVDPGQTVAASLQTPTLFTIAEDLREMELHVNVDEAEVGLVSEGQQARFTVDAYSDRVFNATISQVRYGPQNIEGVVSYITVLKVDNSELLLRPGMTATADIETAKRTDVLLVPNTAFRFEPQKAASRESGANILSRLMPRPRRGGATNRSTAPNRSRLWVLEGGKPRRIEVTPGATDGIITEVSGDALREGTEVIISEAQS